MSFHGTHYQTCFFPKIIIYIYSKSDAAFDLLGDGVILDGSHHKGLKGFLDVFLHKSF